MSNISVEERTKRLKELDTIYEICADDYTSREDFYRAIGEKLRIDAAHNKVIAEEELRRQIDKLQKLIERKSDSIDCKSIADIIYSMRSFEFEVNGIKYQISDDYDGFKNFLHKKGATIELALYDKLIDDLYNILRTIYLNVDKLSKEAFIAKYGTYDDIMVFINHCIILTGLCPQYSLDILFMKKTRIYSSAGFINYVPDNQFSKNNSFFNNLVNLFNEYYLNSLLNRRVGLQAIISTLTDTLNNGGIDIINFYESEDDAYYKKIHGSSSDVPRVFLSEGDYTSYLEPGFDEISEYYVKSLTGDFCDDVVYPNSELLLLYNVAFEFKDYCAKLKREKDLLEAENLIDSKNSQLTMFFQMAVVFSKLYKLIFPGRIEFFSRNFEEWDLEYIKNQSDFLEELYRNILDIVRCKNEVSKWEKISSHITLVGCCDLTLPDIQRAVDYIETTNDCACLRQIPYWFRRGDIQNDTDILMVKPGTTEFELRNLWHVKNNYSKEQQLETGSSSKRLVVTLPSSLAREELLEIVNYSCKFASNINFVCENELVAEFIKRHLLEGELASRKTNSANKSLLETCEDKCLYSLSRDGIFISIDPDYYDNFFLNRMTNRQFWNSYQYVLSPEHSSRLKYPYSLIEVFDFLLKQALTGQEDSDITLDTIGISGFCDGAVYSEGVERQLIELRGVDGRTLKDDSLRIKYIKLLFPYSYQYMLPEIDRWTQYFYNLWHKNNNETYSHLEQLRRYEMIDRFKNEAIVSFWIKNERLMSFKAIFGEKWPEVAKDCEQTDCYNYLLTRYYYVPEETLEAINFVKYVYPTKWHTILLDEKKFELALSIIYGCSTPNLEKCDPKILAKVYKNGGKGLETWRYFLPF